MQSNKNEQTQFATTNLLNDEIFQSFLKVQTQFGAAQQGGSILYTQDQKQKERLVSDVNFLHTRELENLVYQHFIGSN